MVRQDVSGISSLHAWICGRIEVYKSCNDPSAFRDKARYMENYSNLELKELVELYRYCSTHLAPIRQPPSVSEIVGNQEEQKDPGNTARARIMGISLPADGEFQGEFILNRFSHALPSEDFNPEDMSVQKPWFVQAALNQIEMVTVTITQGIRLTGIGVAKPILKTETGRLEYFEILDGDSSNSPVLFRGLENRNLMPQSSASPEVYQSFTFRNAVNLEPMRQYVFLFKISGCSMTYKGDPKARVDILIGADNTLWEFSPAKNKDERFVNGQGHITGPLLRVIYRLMVH